jgi:hypothetical protein
MKVIKGKQLPTDEVTPILQEVMELIEEAMSIATHAPRGGLSGSNFFEVTQKGYL